jgi:hypothetical protein
MKKSREAMSASLPPDMKQQIEAQIAKLATPEGREEVKAELEASLETAKAAGVPAAQLAMMETMIKQLAQPAEPASDGAAPAAPVGGTGTGLLIALQDAKGAYLTGWQATLVGETWTFSGAPSTPESRARSIAFDGIGPAGFNGGSATAAAPADAAKDKDKDSAAGDKPTDGGDGGGGGNEGGGGDGRKSTPAGPITIPGGGGGGGGGGG